MTTTPFVNDMTTRYRYNGQMTIEEDVTFMDGETSIVDQTSYLVGARGYEMIHAKRLAGPNPSNFDKKSYPIYDGHGNMIATLAKAPGAGTPPVPGTYTIENVKKYDVWGAVRSSTGAGTHVVNPNKQYCANLGHTFDGESNLIYMRARYYEPSSGRFISEDPARDGSNWFNYCHNSPTRGQDFSGKVVHAILVGAILGFLIGFCGSIGLDLGQGNQINWGNALLAGAVCALAGVASGAMIAAGVVSVTTLGAASSMVGSVSLLALAKASLACGGIMFASGLTVGLMALALKNLEWKLLLENIGEDSTGNSSMGAGDPPYATN